LGFDGPLSNKFVGFVKALYDAYLKADCTIVEINPLVVTADGDLIALDAKINFDDNALFRHPDYEPLRDLDEEDPAEIEAKKYDLTYISLDGTIGCMVNGAGLAMAGSSRRRRRSTSGFRSSFGSREPMSIWGKRSFRNRVSTLFRRMICQRRRTRWWDYVDPSQ